VLIDRVQELEPGKRIVALKNVSFNEGFFSGHFPSRPIMPGVLIIEAMAQASIVLFSVAKDEQRPNYYLGAVKARFSHPVFPGDQLKVVVEPLKLITSAAIVKAKAQVSDKEVAEAELTFSIK
jgi:3-hydroxyacyl-[acyl-carrier-protein] dehydratase